MQDEKPEIMFIDINKEYLKQLNSNDFVIRFGTLGKSYRINKDYDYLKCGLNHNLDLLTEQDIIFIDTSVSDEISINPLEKKQFEQSGEFYSPNTSDSIFYPQFISGKIYYDKIQALLNLGKIVVVFSSKVTSQEHKIYNHNDGYHDFLTNNRCSNYSIILGKYWNLQARNISKGRKIITNKNSPASYIFKNCENDIRYEVNFTISKDNGQFLVCKNNLNDNLGYIKFFDNNGVLLVLPHFTNLSIPIKNILYDFLPDLKPELLPRLVRSNWINSEEYILPEIKQLYEKKEIIKEKYNLDIEQIEKQIDEKSEELAFLTGIIKSDGQSEKLVNDVFKVLDYIGYKNIINMDNEKNEDEVLEEDLQIRYDKEIIIVEIKGTNGMPSEDMYSAIVKYLARRRHEFKNRNKNINGLLIVNHQKNLEPKTRENPAFSKTIVKDAIRDKCCLIATWELYQAVRLFQSNIISFEEIDKEIHDPGLFNAIPRSWGKIGEIIEMYEGNTIACMQLEIDKLNKNDELVVISGNDYFIQKNYEIHINKTAVNEAKKGDAISIKLDKRILKSASIYKRFS